MKRIPLGFCIVAAVAALALGARALRSSPPSSARKAASAVPADLQRDVEELRARVAALGTQAQPNGPALPIVAPAAPGAVAEPSPPPALTQAEAHAIKILELDAQLQGEQRDASWSPATEQSMAAVFHEDALAGSRLSEVRCGSTLCRARVENPTREAQKELASKIMNLPPFDYGVYYSFEKGSNATVLYVLRPGEDATPQPSE